MATGRLPDPNTAPVTAKGDLYTYSTVPAKLAVGSNGETLVADSSTSTGLRWQGNFAAGKNKIINGAFDHWQRGTSFSPTSAAIMYTADRFAVYNNGSGTLTASQQTFTAGTAPVAGYEGQYFHRIATAASLGTTTQFSFQQRIEDVRTFAGQKVTYSFWAKLNSSQASAVSSLEITQNFGSGGSASVATYFTNPSLTTSWARYSATITVPSISGKTIGTSSFIAFTTTFNAQASQNVDIWGVQLEAGDTATAFQTATGTLAGELAACQRYYFRNTGGATYSVNGQTIGLSSTTATGMVYLPVQMRVKPTSVEYANLLVNEPGVTNLAITALTLDANDSGPNIANVSITTNAGLTASRAGRITNNNNTGGYLGFSAEL